MNAERAAPVSGLLSIRLRRLAGIAILCWLLPTGANELPAADGPVKFDLKGRAEQMVVGGQGRYLVVSIPSELSAFVVDVVDGVLKHTIELPSSRCSVAANRSELIVADLTGARASRYKLEEGSKIGPTVIFPGTVGWIGMGAASQGPLWAHEDYYRDSKALAELSILDARTLQKVKHIELPQYNRPKLTARNRSTNAITSVVVSDDGTTFTDSHQVVQIRGKKPTIIWHSGGVPSFDGNMMLETSPPFPTATLPPAIPTSDHQLLPGRGTALFAMVRSSEQNLLVTAHDLNQFQSNHALPQPLGSLVLPHLPKPPEDKDSRTDRNRPLAMVFLPQAGVIARIEQAGTTLVLHPIKLSPDWDAKTPVTSIPQVGFCAARAGEPVDYQIPIPAGCRVKECRLILGPSGMSVTNDARLEWTPPAGRPSSQECEALVQVVGEENDLQSHRIVMTIGTVGPATHYGKPSQLSRPMPLVGYDSMLTGELPDINPNIDRSAILRLPSPVENVYLAAGGNYLVMEMPGIELMGIFDVTAGKMISYLSHQADVFATSADSIVLGYTAAHRLERWQIPQLKRVAEKQLEDRWRVKDLRMGSNASQWLAVDHGSLFNAADLSLDYDSQPHARSWRATEKEAFQISPDGSLFVVNEFDQSQILTFSMSDKEWQFRTFPTRSKLAIPTGDGRGIIVDQGVLDISDHSQTGRLVPFRSQLYPAAAGPWGLQLPEVQLLAGSATSTHRLNIVNFKTGKTIGAIDGLFEINDLQRQPSAWLLPKQERFLQLDPSRTLLLRKQVRLSQ